jgi:hypothetical protein
VEYALYWPFTPVTGVRLPVGTPVMKSSGCGSYRSHLLSWWFSFPIIFSTSEGNQPPGISPGVPFSARRHPGPKRRMSSHPPPPPGSGDCFNRTVAPFVRIISGRGPSASVCVQDQRSPGGKTGKGATLGFGDGDRIYRSAFDVIKRRCRSNETAGRGGPQNPISPCSAPRTSRTPARRGKTSGPGSSSAPCLPDRTRRCPPG